MKRLLCVLLALMMLISGAFAEGTVESPDALAFPRGFEINSDMMAMMGGFTALRLFTLMGGMMDVKFTKEQLLDINKKLNKIKAPKK